MEVGFKLTDVRRRVEDALNDSARKVRFSVHAEERIEKRILDHPRLTVRDVFRVLRKGRRDEERDEWSHVEQRWSYCFSGAGVDGDPLRVCVAVTDPGVLIVTVVRPGDADW